MRRAIHLVATGKRKNHRAALACGLHLRKMGMDDKLILHTNEPRWQAWARVLPNTMVYIHDFASKSTTVDDWGVGSDYFASRHIRTRFATWGADYDINLALDTDIAALRPPGAIWEQLGDAPFGMVVDRFANLEEAAWKPSRMLGKVEEWKYMHQNGYVNTAATVWNGGLILWKTCALSHEFFEKWHAEWMRFSHRDQQALARMMNDNPHLKVAMQSLPRAWNRYIFSLNLQLPKDFDEVIFVHCHGAAQQTYREEWRRSAEIIPREKR